jgi:hypothetical protein
MLLPTFFGAQYDPSCISRQARIEHFLRYHPAWSVVAQAPKGGQPRAAPVGRDQAGEDPARMYGAGRGGRSQFANVAQRPSKFVSVNLAWSVVAQAHDSCLERGGPKREKVGGSIARRTHPALRGGRTQLGAWLPKRITVVWGEEGPSAKRWAASSSTS